MVPVDVLTVFGLTASVGITYIVLFIVFVGFLPEEVIIAKETQDRFGIHVPYLNTVLDRFS